MIRQVHFSKFFKFYTVQCTMYNVQCKYDEERLISLCDIYTGIKNYIKSKILLILPGFNWLRVTKKGVKSSFLFRLLPIGSSLYRSS